MGEYADDATERDLLYALDHNEPLGMGSYFLEFEIKEIIRETPKAWLILLIKKHNCENNQIWFPKSKCQVNNNKISIPDWLAVAKGLPLLF